MKNKFLLVIIIFLNIICCTSSNNEANETEEEESKYYYKAELENNYNNSLILNLETSVKDNYTLVLNLVSSEILQIIFRDKNQSRFELPKTEPFPYHKYQAPLSEIIPSKLKYKIEIDKFPFILRIKRRDTKETIFETRKVNPFGFLKNYSYFHSFIPSENIFGFGQRTSSFKLKSGIYTLFNRDNAWKLDYGVGKDNQRYGSHPMYLAREQSGKYFINYLRNSFPLDIVLKKENLTLSYHSAGGIFDFSLFLGEYDPNYVIKSYHKFLGGWILPPFWSFGFHQSRWGFRNLNEVERLLNKFDTENIKIDSIWLDLDYMNKSSFGTWNSKTFNPDEFKEDLDLFKVKYVLLIEPAVSIKSMSNILYSLGLNLTAFIKENETDYIKGKVWSGPSYFIDFFNPNSSSLLYEALENLYNISNFSGIWEDMNEIATFSFGKINDKEDEQSCLGDVFPYYPGGYMFEHKTICPNALHYKNFTNLQIHNYYPNQQSKIVYNYLLTKFPDQFPFILSRGNSPGIGKYSFLWSGDNQSNYTWYMYSLSEIFSMSLYGIPFNGVDVCGFAGDTNEKLCSKWYQLGVFYPFCRNHKHLNYNSNHPFSHGKTLLNTAKASIDFRYKMLKYYYYLFMKEKFTGTVFKPLFYEFYNDENTLNDFVINFQFLIGNDIMVIPNMNFFNISEVIGYFPYGNWYQIQNYKKISKGFHIIDIKLNESLPIYLREGGFLFLNSNVTKIRNSIDLNKDNEYDLFFALKNNLGSFFSGYGEIPFLSDYHSKDEVNLCIKKNCYMYLYANLDFITKQLSIKFSKTKFTKLKQIKIKKINLFFPFNIDDINFVPNFRTQNQIKTINHNCLEILFNKHKIIYSNKTNFLLFTFED